MVRSLVLGAVLANLPVAGESLRGRVAADDGLPLSGSTVVALRCPGGSLATAPVDSQGRFEIAVDRPASGCDLEIESPRYRTARIPAHSLPADPRVPAVALFRLGKAGGESLSTSHLAAPPEAVGHFHAALRAAPPDGDGAPDIVLQHLQEAVRVFPGYAQAWHEIGRLRMGLDDPAGAEDAFERAVQSDPWFVSPYHPLILLRAGKGDTDGSRRACQGLRRIHPQLPPNCL